jgi:RNA polymerase sigma factor (sigma-70 family)
MAGIAADFPRARMPAAALRVLSDDRLVRHAAAGDSRAFELIYERHHQALYRYCRSMVGNEHDAADALQSTMASALRGLAGESREIALKPWLFRIAHNECISLIRKRRPHVEIDDSLGLEAPEHDPGLRERLRELVSDLQELPDGQRGALVMHELNGLPYRDIATAFDTTEPHARQLVYEARTALHDLAEGRAMACEDVRRAISDGDGRVLRGRRMRSHLRACEGCQTFNDLLRSRRRDLAMLAPPIPAAAALGVLHKVIGGNASGASAAAASSAATGGSLGSLVAGKAVAGPLVAKAVAVLAVAAAAGAGAVEVATGGHGAGSSSTPAVPGAKSHAARSAGGGAATTLPATSSAGGRHSSGAGAAPGHGSAASGAAGTHGNSQFGRSHAPAHSRPSHPSHPSHPAHPVTGGNGVGNAGHPAKPQHPPKPAHPPKPQDRPNAPASRSPRTTVTPPSTGSPKTGQTPASTKTPPATTNNLGSTLEDAGTSGQSLPPSGADGLHKGATAAPTG